VGIINKGVVDIIPSLFHPLAVYKRVPVHVFLFK